MTERTYRIGEAARLLDLEGYVLRFWETEFAQLRPMRTAKGQRLYSEADIALLRRIRFLLHEQGMTIEGARRVLEESSSEGYSSAVPSREQGPWRELLKQVEEELEAVRLLLGPRS